MEKGFWITLASFAAAYTINLLVLINTRNIPLQFGNVVINFAILPLAAIIIAVIMLIKKKNAIGYAALLSLTMSVISFLLALKFTPPFF